MQSTVNVCLKDSWLMHIQGILLVFVVTIFGRCGMIANETTIHKSMYITKKVKMVLNRMRLLTIDISSVIFEGNIFENHNIIEQFKVKLH